ncbi:MAG: hypothetical protein IJA96_05680 [Alistipes sp.]|nr:hypothetical protein [Alistipes sp.]MBR2437161.1 hypothetical protein [Alistipes sp.]
MTNKYANWERLESVIRWANMTTNFFAIYIGLNRAENLYHIKRGNYGISFDLADRIVKCFPEINRTWLLTGAGSMLNSEIVAGNEIAYYNDEVENILPDLKRYSPIANICLPSISGCEIVARTYQRAMCEPTCAVTELFLKRVELDEIIQGNEYVLVLKDNSVIWRKLRLTANEQEWRLVARNRDDFEDIIITQKNIAQAWRVIAKTAIMSS